MPLVTRPMTIEGAFVWMRSAGLFISWNILAKARRPNMLLCMRKKGLGTARESRRSVSGFRPHLDDSDRPARPTGQLQVSSCHAHVQAGRPQPHGFRHTPRHVTAPVQGCLMPGTAHASGQSMCPCPPRAATCRQYMHCISDPASTGVPLQGALHQYS